MLRREEIKLQVALITPLNHIKGNAAPETKAAVEKAHLLIEQAEALGEPPEDPLLLFSVLDGPPTRLRCHGLYSCLHRTIEIVLVWRDMTACDQLSILVDRFRPSDGGWQGRYGSPPPTESS
jgi:hypothetical protein